MVWLGATSVLLLIAVAVAVALPRLYRRRNFGQIHAQRPAEDMVSTEAGGESKSISEPALDDRDHSDDVGHSGDSAPSLRIKYDRLVLFTLGLIALLSSFILVFISALGSLSWLWPMVAGSLALASVVILRFLAIRDARARNTNTLDTVGTSAASPVSDGDREGREKAWQRAGQKPVSQAAKSLRQARAHRSSARPRLEGTSGVEELRLRAKIEPRFESVHVSWQPTEVPQPTYLDLDEVVRRPPQPLQLPVYEKSRTRTLAQAQQVAEESGKLKLDEILKRRRAS